MLNDSGHGEVLLSIAIEISQLSVRQSGSTPEEPAPPPTIAMTHIAVQEALDGKVVEWMEHVTDEPYKK